MTEPTPRDSGGDRLDMRLFDLHVLTVSISTLLLMVLCWPLWLDTAAFPQVPFVRSWPKLPEWVSALLLYGIGVSLVLVGTNLCQRRMAQIALIFLLIMIPRDQSRLQPWLYQAILELLVLAYASRAIQPTLIRAIIASIYAHSGLSKLDYSFVHELGPILLQSLLGIFGHQARPLSPTVEHVMVLGMPLLEILIAILLIASKFSRMGLFGALFLHIALFLIVGPTGLGHSATVVGWNLALLISVPLLFWGQRTGILGLKLCMFRSEPICGLVLALILVPLGERWGIWDSWPSFAVYASHNERTEIFASSSGAIYWPEDIRGFLVPTKEPDRLKLDTLNWSRFTRGVPIYPQARTGIGIAIALADEIGGGNPFFARVLSRSNSLTGHREIICEGGVTELRDVANHFFWNALPATKAERWKQRRPLSQ